VSIGTIVVDLLARTGSFETDTKRAARIAKQRAKEIDEAFAKAGKAIGVALAAGAAAAAAVFKTTVDRMDELSKAAQRAQLPTEDFSRLAYAGKLADVSMQDLQTAMGRLAKAQGDAIDGTGEQADAFAALGISVKNADGSLRNTGDVFLEFADKFQEFQGSPEVMAAGMKLFGRSFQNLIPLLKDGSQGLRDAGAEADAFGVTLSTKAGKDAEAFNDNLTRLGEATRGAAQIISGEMLGSAVQFTDQLVELAKEAINADGGIRDMARDGTFKEWAQNAAIAVATLAESLLAVGKMAIVTGNAFLAAWKDIKLGSSVVQNMFGGWMFESNRKALADALADRNSTVESFNKRLDDLLHYNGTAMSDALRQRFNPAMFDGSLLAGPRASRSSGRRPRPNGGAGKGDPLQGVIDAATQRDYERMEALKRQGEEFDAWLAQKVEDDKQALKDQADAWRDVVDPTAAYVRQLEEIRKLVQSGDLSPAEGLAAEFEVQTKIQDKLMSGMGKAKEALTEVDQWAKQAANNIQDALGDGLYDILSGNFDNIGKSFGNMLKRMLAEATAAQISRALFGDFGTKSGSVGGLLGDGLKWLAGAFGLGGARAGGGPVSGGTTYLVGERGPEFFTPNTSGTIVPNGGFGGGLTINSTINAAPGMNAAQFAAMLDERDARLMANVGQGLRRGRFDWAMA
jgi:hypothetical protein